jgi:hypothetical protein
LIKEILKSTAVYSLDRIAVLVKEEGEVRLVTCRWCGAKVLANMYLRHLDHCPGYQRWIRRHLKVRGKALSVKS